MDKFRDVIMKLSENSSPKQKSFIEEHLTNFLSDFNAPDHPPYAAMIHRAIQELNEKGGSTEESISQYIKKQYADLPWAHNSLLKHHLGNLCDCGEILVTRKNFYLLAGAKPNLDCPIRPKKGHLKRKQKGESRRGQGRQCKKNEAEECDKCREEHCEVIGEHNKCNIEQDKFTGEHNEIKEYKVDMVGEHNQLPKPPNEVTEELIESDEQHHEVIGSEAYDQRIGVTRDGDHEPRDGRIEGLSQPLRQDVGISVEPEQGQPRWLETVISAEQSQPQQKQEGYAICVPLVDSNVQIEHLEKQNQPDLSSPERPPGFEFATFKEFSKSLEQTKDLLDLEQYEVLPNSERLSEVELPMVKDFSETLQQIKEEEQWRQLKHEGRDPSEFPRSAPSTIMMKLLPVKHQQQQPELSNSEGLQEGKSKDLEFLEQNQKQLKQYSRRKQVKSQTKERKAKDVPVDSEHIKQKRQPDLPDPVKSSGLKLTIVESFTTEKQQQLEICGEQEATESQTGAMVPMVPKRLDKVELPDKLVPGSLTELQQVTARGQQEGRKTQYAPIDSELIKQKQHLDLSDPEQSSALKLTTVESFLTEKQQRQLEICGEQQAPEPQSGSILTSSDLYMDAKRLDKEEPDTSVPASPLEPKQVTDKSQTELEQRQVVRRSQRLAKSKQTATSSVDLFPCSQLQDRHLGQPELQDCELPREIKQKPVEESTHITKQQAKLCSWQKHKTSQPTTETYSPDSSLKSEQSLLQVEESAQIIEQHAKRHAHQKQKKSQPNTVMNSLDISLVQKQLDESTLIVEQRVKLRSWRKRYTSQSITVTDSLHSPMALEQVELEEQPELPCSEWYKQAEALEDLPRQQQVALAQGKPTCMKLRPRPPKPESEAAASPIELSPACHQHDRKKQPERRDRGRPPKPKPDTVEMQSDHQNHYERQQTAQRAGGRPPKLTAKAEVVFNTNSPYNSHQEQEQEQEQEAQKPTYRGRGKPLKPKQTTTSTTHFIPSSKQHQQPKCCGRGRPWKMDQGSE